ncbi:MAG: T9SS type A sorting domain-containing protein, partial [Candidatus Eisenbacteria bacterium]|nr:T9SS type A sorting domain-containing protein [Candidatus Eisenbacteria bacterium]
DGLYYALPHCDSSAGSDGPVSNPAAYNATVRLIGARPNPFNPKTSIDFTLTTPQKIRVAIYNLEGRHVTTLCDKGFSPGPHSIVWNGLDSDGRPVASNLYMIRLEGEREQEVKKVIYLK